MIFNVDFLIAALLFMLIILYHFMEQQALYLQNNRTFLWLIVLGILSICFDIICTVLITLSVPSHYRVLETCILILYVLQVLVSNAFLVHVFKQFPSNVGSRLRRVFHCAVVPSVMICLILTNHWHRLFFDICSTGFYTRGPLYPLMYVMAAYYLSVAALSCMIYRSHLSRFQRVSLWEIVLIVSLTLVIQALNHSSLMTGYGIALAITVLFFTLNNPYHYTDSLTSTFDIRYFRDRSESYMHHQKQFHVLFVELTQLKRLNKVTGSGFGNQLLQVIAQMLRDTDKRNLVFRISGRRFVVITTSLVLYENTRTRILDFFSRPVTVAGKPVIVPAAVCGIVDAESLRTSDSLLAYADYLLSIIPFSVKPQLVQDSEETLKGFRYHQIVESFLNTAVEQDLFDVAFQPVYSTVQQKYVSCEALSRLSHPSLGPISPEIFIRLAERTDQIAQIDLLQLRRVCRFVQENPGIMDALENIKFNLSPVELMKPGHVDHLIQIIRDHDLPTSFFQFEITETAATDYSTSLSIISEKFTEAHIGLCLDDFGSGYANLNSMFRLPFDIIKLDRSLLVDISRNKRAASLYHGLISSIQSMDVKIVAEGVETVQELEMVCKCGVDLIQGFYFSRPLPPQELLKLTERISGLPSRMTIGDSEMD